MPPIAFDPLIGRSASSCGRAHYMLICARAVGRCLPSGWPHLSYSACISKHTYEYQAKLNLKNNTMSLLSSSSHSSNSSVDSDLDSHKPVVASPSHTPQTISKNLDEYICAAKVGRASLACGDLQESVQHFDQALGIELQTELDCLYDTSLGFVSGLVRKEVDNRLHGGSRGAPSSDKVLDELAKVYRDAEICAEVKPTQAKWYLRMGAALCVVNQWDKARLIYKEGLHMCKDKRELQKALKNLTKIELITSGIEIPKEDWRPTLYNPLSRPETSSKKNHRPKPRSISTLKPSVQRVRPKSVSVDAADLPNHAPGVSRPRNASISQVDSRSFSDPPSPAQNRKRKPLRRARPLSGVFTSRNAPVPIIGYDERQSWIETFKSHSNSLDESHDYFRPSAVAHMRRLSVETSHSSGSITSLEGVNDALTFGSVTFTSLKIDSDDSELDDSDS